MSELTNRRIVIMLAPIVPVALISTGLTDLLTGGPWWRVALWLGWGAYNVFWATRVVRVALTGSVGDLALAIRGRRRG